MTLASLARAQVSPGPLSRAHRDLDTPLRCLSCHGQGSRTAMTGRCLACHREITWLIDRREGLHGQEGRDDCVGCHRDHKGTDGAIIRWKEGSPERFDHARAAWPLDGRHASLKCRECHRSPLQRSGSAPLIRRSEKEASFLGLDRGCVSCHEPRDIHRGSLGTRCDQCHEATAWKPAPRFDHVRSGFPLTGAHARVRCEKCHLAPALRLARDNAGRPVPQFKPLPHGECSSCHADPHGTRFGPACTRCHAADSWKSVDRKVFRHDITRFPLRGKHVAVRCEQCHDAATAWGKKPPFASCGSCHRDSHAGQATLAGRAADCESCHSVEGFRPGVFSVSQHTASRFPLGGAHARVPCERCHRKNPPGVAAEKLGKAGVLLRMPFGRCRDCHADAHGGQLARRADQGACEACHKVDGWKPSTFTVSNHANLRFPLEGRHGKVECAACHGPRRPGLPPAADPAKLGKAAVDLHPAETACASCHLDPHQGRFDPKGARPKSRSCRTCHGLESFRPSLVDVPLHRTFAYPLEGAHRAVPCSGCHRESSAAPVKSSLILASLRFSPLPFTHEEGCESCHRNPHGSQFAHRADRGACKGCHTEASFRPAGRFEHGRDSEFPLDGAHTRVACARCHVPRAAAPGQPAVIYRPLPHQCRDCHTGRLPGKQARLSPAAPESGLDRPEGGGA